MEIILEEYLKTAEFPVVFYKSDSPADSCSGEKIPFLKSETWLPIDIKKITGEVIDGKFFMSVKPSFYDGFTNNVHFLVAFSDREYWEQFIEQ